jgi:peptide/nickel transport system ATP-binding protein
VKPSEPPERIVVEDLTVVLTGSAVPVVESTSFHIRPGEVLGVVGESGSGKTTLALAAIGHVRRGLRIAWGSVRLDGTELLALSPGQLRPLRGAAMAYVPQDPGSALNPAIRVGTQLREILAAHRWGSGHRAAVDRRVNEVLEEVGLEASAKLLAAFPHQLSGGQRQRITLAMAFACRPGLIVLDEPTTGLDVTTQRRVLDTVRELCRSYGVAALYVSHDVPVVAEVSQRVAVVYAGRIVETGPTAVVLGSAVHPYTQSLLRAVPSLGQRQELATIAGVAPRPGEWPKGCAFAPRCPVSLAVCATEPPPMVDVNRSPPHRVRCVLAVSSVETRPALVAGPRAPAAPCGARASGPSVLDVNGLSASYGAHRVLHAVRLVIPERQCVALVGESGSGKTTLARCISGLHRRWVGEIGYRGEPLPPGVRDRSRSRLRSIQYVFQNPYLSLNPRRTVGGTVKLSLDHFAPDLPQGERERRVVEAVRSVALDPAVISCYPDQLSGGERQRVAIARALVVQPELLICDEVTSSLDASVAASIVELLRRLREERGLSMLFITHNLALVWNVARHVVVMQQGRVVEHGLVEEVVARPKAEYTARLLRDAPRFDGVTAERAVQ